MKTPQLIVTACLALTITILGCAHLNPGADPLVVRVEQGESGAQATFDMVLSEDNANRPFWRTNAPAYHGFCEWLRTPVDYTGTNVPRCVAMQLRVDDLKLAYKGTRTSGNSNLLYSAFTVLEKALNQSSAWQIIVSTPTNP